MSSPDDDGNVYSQSGEDAVIEEIFRIVGEGDRTCVEFGAKDGLSTSNTAHLWRDLGWKATLLEADPASSDECRANIDGFDVNLIEAKITPTGASSIDELLAGTAPHFMSIDVDGADYHIFEAMQMRPTLVCVEYNCSFPPHLVVYPDSPDNYVGCSSRALYELGRDKGYTMVRSTLINAFFIVDDLAPMFEEEDISYEHLLGDREFTYYCTDYDGTPVILGRQPWWGPAIQIPPPGLEVRGVDEDSGHGSGRLHRRPSGRPSPPTRP